MDCVCPDGCSGGLLCVCPDGCSGGLLCVCPDGCSGDGLLYVCPDGCCWLSGACVPPVFLISVMILPWFFMLCGCGLLIDKIESRFMAPVDFVAALIMLRLHSGNESES